MDSWNDPGVGSRKMVTGPPGGVEYFVSRLLPTVFLSQALER
jgi:hypothetical protein